MAPPRDPLPVCAAHAYDPLHSALIIAIPTTAQVAARQRLFDYAVEQGLAILNATVKNTTIAEINATVEVPLLGGIEVGIRDGASGGCDGCRWM